MNVTPYAASRIATMSAIGMSAGQIAQALNIEGVPTLSRMPHARWGKSAVRSAIRYIGVPYTHGKPGRPRRTDVAAA